MGGANNQRAGDTEYTSSYCTNCGNEVAPTDNHCANCGAPISDIDPGDPPTTWDESSDLQSVITRVSGEEKEKSTPNDLREEDGSIDLSNKKIATIGTGLTFFGTLLPWVTVSALGTRASALGVETLGLLATIGGGIAFVGIWKNEWDNEMREIVVGVSVFTLVLALVGLVSPLTLLLEEADSELQRAITGAGIGVYVTGIGSILSLVGGRQVLDE